LSLNVIAGTRATGKSELEQLGNSASDATAPSGARPRFRNPMMTKKMGNEVLKLAGRADAARF
jgi:hypothetical protein